MKKFLVSVVVVIVACFAAAAAVAAAEGVTVESDTTYELLPSDGLMHVESVFTLTNVTPNTRRNYVTTRYYYDGYGIPIPSSAVNIVATAGSRELELEIETITEDDFSYDLALVSFRRNLFYRQTTEFTLSYDLPGDDPRSEFGYRINPAYVHVFADGIGDDGKVDVRVRIPVGYTIETFGDSVTRILSGDFVTLEALDIENPRDWFVQISARDDSELYTYNLIVGERSLQLQYWPGDSEWVEFVRDKSTSGIPNLERLIGRPWPDEDILEVQESFTPLLYGYAGWYTASLDRIELTEELDEKVLYHELSHVWFNDNLFEERWINEGLADEFATLVMKEQGFSISPRSISEFDPGFVPLNLWDTPSPQLSEETYEDREYFGYNASWWVLHQLSKEIGTEGLGNAMDMAFNGTIAYVGEAEPEDVEHGYGWKRFLDVLELGGGSELASELFAEHVVVGPDTLLITERSEARNTYDEFAARSGDWAVPFGIRDSMDSWEFEEAIELMTKAELALDVRDEVEASVSEMDLVSPETMESPYESAVDSFDEVIAMGESQLEAMAEILNTEREIEIDRGFFAEIGLRGEDLVVELQDARIAFENNYLELVSSESQDVITHAEDLERVGKRRVAWLLLAIGIGLSFVFIIILLSRRWRRKRRRRRETELGDVSPTPDSSREPTLELPILDDKSEQVSPISF